jgi:hypothetical protein
MMKYLQGELRAKQRVIYFERKISYVEELDKIVDEVSLNELQANQQILRLLLSYSATDQDSCKLSAKAPMFTIKIMTMMSRLFDDWKPI